MTETEIPELNISNICGGAVPERFDLEVREVLKNIKDLNTAAEAKRTLTIKFEFSPSKDRNYVAVDMSVSRKNAVLETVSGGLFLRGDGDRVRAFTEDPRQLQIFAGEPTVTDKKQ